MLIDGHSLFHRAFFALPPLTTARGQHTNAVYGFLNMLFRLLEDERPEYLAVTFDKGAPTFRHHAFDGYKAHRPEMADELRSQVPLLRAALDALRIPVFELEGYEADDLLGTLARRAAEAGFRVLVVTGDRDLLQLVGPGVEALLTRKGISELERFDAAAVRERYGVEPGQLPDVKALMGDPSDNIPGVPGIGEKTAVRLIQKFGSLAALLERPEEAGPRLARLLAEHREQAEMSRRLALIVRDAPLDADLEACRRVEPDREAVRRLFTDLEFRSLLRRLGGDGGGRAAARADAAPVAAARADAAPLAAVPSVAIAADEEAAREQVAGLRRAAEGGARLTLVPGRTGLLVAAVFAPAAGGDAGAAGPYAFFPGAIAALEDGGEGRGRLPAPLLALLEAAEIPKQGHGLKPLARLLRRAGRRLAGLASDTAVAAYLLDPTRTGYRLEDLARHHLDRDLGAEEAEGSAEEAATAAGEGALLAARAAVVAELAPRLERELSARGLDRLYNDVELPLVDVLADMEAAGVLVDPAVLDELGREFAARLETLAAEIYALAGERFNINSTQQLAEILFGRLGLPAVRKTKTGYSTDAAVLEELAGRHPIAALILQYRHFTKLLGTYVEGLRGLIDPRTGRVHTTFHQTVTATGRLSSADPNLQNIPVREEMGRRLRRAFVAPPGHLLLAADYSQIELRILAHFAGDEALVRAFHEGADIHRATAAEVFGVAPDEVTEAMRDAAKVVNFGVVYGISDYGLAQNLNIERAEARGFIDGYFARFPGVRRYMEEIVARARREGMVRTLMGRIRPIPEINSKNYARRQFAERTALNTPIQGTAADIIKTAMVRLHRELEAGGLRARLILQVHDELILEVPEDEVEAARALVTAVMEGAAELAVPLKVDVKVGPNWYEMR